MSLTILLIAAAAAEPDPSILVTATREPAPRDAVAASAAVLDQPVIERLALPAAADLLRLLPGASVARTGPRGTQTQLRIRGAEANHSLLFVDGIRFNDPAAGNEARFELLTADLLSRIELVRGPQSALWGAEALGGVVAVETPDPLRARGFAALGEYGSQDSGRMFGRYAAGSEAVGVVASAGWQRGDGVDSLGGGLGDRDGFDLMSASLKAVHRSGLLELGTVGHWIEGRSEYDGFDPLTFLRADTLDITRSRIGAVRAWGRYAQGGWDLRAGASYLDSANRNRLAGMPINGTFGDRLSLDAQASRRIGGHRLIAAVEHQAEDFRRRDADFSGATNQDRGRHLTAVVGEWRAQWTGAVITDIALRHDAFSAFADATTVRAAVLVRPADGWTLHAAYGEGIAQPTFFDLFGFFPGSFVGNPGLRPETTEGWEAGLRFENDRFRFAVTGFTARLDDEIVETFDPATFLSSAANADRRSRRDGAEVEARWRLSEGVLLFANYTFLDAEEQRASGGAQLREIRRPPHSFNLAAHGETGRLSWGASLAYAGKRRDTDFDLFPARTVTLDAYWLASLNLSYRILPQLEVYGRIENGFDADYQDVVGYNTPGRTVHAGLRVALDR